MIKVLQPGLYSTIQDVGRYNFQSVGVPISGVMDAYCAKLANLLVGNFRGECGIRNYINRT